MGLWKVADNPNDTVRIHKELPVCHALELEKFFIGNIRKVTAYPAEIHVVIVH